MLTFLLLMAPVALAETVTPAIVLDSVDRFHPKILAAEQDALAARADFTRARGGFDPTLEGKATGIPYGDYEYGLAQVLLRQATPFWGLSVFGGWGYGRGDVPSYKGEEATSSGGEAQFGVELPLLRGGPIDERRADIARSGYFVDVANWKAQETVLALKRDALRSYWIWFAAGHRVAVAEELLRLAEERDIALRQRVERGDLPRIEQLDNQRTILSRRGLVVKAQRAFEKAAIKLSLFLRQENGRPILGVLQQLPAIGDESSYVTIDLIEQDIERALATRPEVRQLELREQQIRVNEKLSANERLPNLDISVIQGIDIGSEPYLSERGETRFGLNLKWPILMRRGRGKQAKALAQIAALRAQQQFLRDLLRADILDAHSALTAAHQRLLLAREERTIAHQVEQLERDRLDLGGTNLLTVNLRERFAAEAERKAINALAAYEAAVNTYQAATLTGPFSLAPQ